MNPKSRHWTVYWKFDEIRQMDSDPDARGDGIWSEWMEKRGVSEGDVVWVITWLGGEVFLVGRLKVSEFSPGVKAIDDSPVLVAEGGVVSGGATLQLVTSLIRDLRFIPPASSTKDRWLLKGGKAEQQQLRSMRELTPESAALLAMRFRARR